MRTVVVGTAGHVDHGKTSLIKALTGVETDRMAEEKRRGISIDIGFAHLSSDDLILDFVDVPGHERFVRNMVCGVTGVDLALLVVAADDGVMPQTREHLDVLTLLGVAGGVIVLSKIDRVDEETVEIAADEIGELVRGTFLDKAPVIRFSSITGEGSAEAVEALGSAARALAPKRMDGIFRMPVDKIYTARGRGTVVAGTVAGGTLGVGEEIAVYPGGLSAKARSLQTHRVAVESIQSGQRAGINLAGLEAASLSRGLVIARPGTVVASHMADARLTLLKTCEHPLKNHERVKIYAGAKEAVARVVPMDRESLGPGESCLVQLRCEEELIVVPGDRFVIRSLSPARTIGGGDILRIRTRKYRKFDAGTLSSLNKILIGGRDELVEEVVRSIGYRLSRIEEVTMLTGITRPAVAKTLGELAGGGKVLFLGGGIIHTQCFVELRAIIEQVLLEEYKRSVLSSKVKALELKSRLAFDVEPVLFTRALESLRSLGSIEFDGREIFVRGRSIRLTARQSEVAKTALSLCRAQRTPIRLATLKEAYPKGAGEAERVLKFLASDGRIVLFKDNSFLEPSVFSDIKAALAVHLAKSDGMSLSQVRDVLGIGRNPLQTILERLDAEGFTKRVGDVRVLAT